MVASVVRREPSQVDEARPSLTLYGQRRHFQPMYDPANSEIQQLARGIAEELAGPDAVKGVEVEKTVDLYDRPACRLSLLIDSAETWKTVGMFRIKLGIRLRDALEAQHDTHELLFRILDRNDWPRRIHA